MIANSPGAWTQRANIGGTSWDAALWSREGQYDRFVAVADELSLSEGDTLLDFGCGTGEFCQMLPSYVWYVGYDWSDGMIMRAQREHTQFVDYRKFWHFEPGGQFDHIVAIGTFNLADNWSKRQTLTVVRRLAEKARKTLVVSLYAGDDPNCISYSLDDFPDSLDGHRVYADQWRKNDILLVVDKTVLRKPVPFGTTDLEVA